MNNKQLYKDTFDRMVLSDESVRRVKDMIEKKEKKYLRRSFRVAVTVAALAVVFVIGNVASYAATGSTLVEKGIEKVSIYIDKKKVDVKDVKKYKDKEGNAYYEIQLGDDNKSASISANEEVLEDEKMSAVTEISEDDLTLNLISRELKKEGEKIYLVVGDGEKVDITEDFSDGKAKGKFKLDGETYKYSVSGTIEKYQIEIKK